MDAEAILRDATRKFRDRFNRMAAEAGRQGAALHQLSLAEMEILWSRTKEEERAPRADAHGAH
jgi:uncharacterized protein YabN with tetrapyrrole methylase and pyrophosphatase domain